MDKLLIEHVATALRSAFCDGHDTGNEGNYQVEGFYREAEAAIKAYESYKHSATCKEDLQVHPTKPSVADRAPEQAKD